MRHLLVLLIAFSAEAREQCTAGAHLKKEVEALLVEARADHDIILVQALHEKLQLLRERELIVCWQMERIADEAWRAVGEALYHVGTTEFEVEMEVDDASRGVGFGVGTGVLTLHGEVAVPLAVPVGFMARYEVSGRFEFAALAGPLITGGDLEGNDKIGLFGILEARGCLNQGRTFCPLIGGHVNAPSINFADGSFFLVERGVHGGLFLPLWDAVRLVARYGVGRQESDRAAGWLNRVGTVTVEARVWRHRQRFTFFTKSELKVLVW